MPAPALRFRPRFVVHQPKPAMPTSSTKSPRTQFFASALAALMERNGVNQVQLAAATGIAVSRINNYLHGRYRTIRPDHLGLLAGAAARTPAERLELARAYLMDLLPADLQAEVRIGAPGGAGRASGRARPEKGLLPGSTGAALAQLEALGARSAKARARMHWFAEILAEAHRA
jgi:transcriptional regulator with XRE-family HTH domain